MADVPLRVFLYVYQSCEDRGRCLKQSVVNKIHLPSYRRHLGPELTVINSLFRSLHEGATDLGHTFPQINFAVIETRDDTDDLVVRSLEAHPSQHIDFRTEF